MYSSLSWKFHFFTAAFLCAAVRGLPTADPHINMTISVPAGTSNHGDPNLLCTPTKWLDVLVFFSANYFAHAATVKALPGETAMDFAFTVFLAIAFPFSGVSRGLEAIMRHASYSRNASNDNAKNDLQTAVRAGALCIVVRDIYWSCRPSDPSYPNYPNLPPKTSDAYPREQIMGERIEVDQESRTDPSVYWKPSYLLRPLTNLNKLTVGRPVQGKVQIRICYFSKGSRTPPAICKAS